MALDAEDLWRWYHDLSRAWGQQCTSEDGVTESVQLAMTAPACGKRGVVTPLLRVVHGKAQRARMQECPTGCSVPSHLAPNLPPRETLRHEPRADLTHVARGLHRRARGVCGACWEFGEGVGSARGVAAIVVCCRNSSCSSSCDAIAHNGRGTLAVFLLFQVQ